MTSVEYSWYLYNKHQIMFYSVWIGIFYVCKEVLHTTYVTVFWLLLLILIVLFLTEQHLIMLLLIEQQMISHYMWGREQNYRGFMNIFYAL